MNVLNVGRPSVVVQTLLYIREFILEKSHINVMNVGKLLAKAQILLPIRGYTTERNSVVWKTKCRKIFRLYESLYVWKTIYERNCMNAMFFIIHFSHWSSLIQHQKINIREKYYENNDYRKVFSSGTSHIIQSSHWRETIWKE